MNTVKVLIKGYAKQTENGWLASCTTTLIKTSKFNILVDPGINKELLLQKLDNENLKIEDIDIVFLTHYHPDHILLAGLFTHAKIYDGTTLYINDEEIEYEGNLPETDIKVIPTPGHANEHASLIVETQDLGTVVVAADVFWWTDEEEQITEKDALMTKEDPFTTDEKALKDSREKVLEIADYIIPGHGEMFKIEK